MKLARLILEFSINYTRFHCSHVASHKVHCSDESMRVEIGLSELAKPAQSSSPNGGNQQGSASDAHVTLQNVSSSQQAANAAITGLHIYLEGLKDYPDERCQAKINETFAVFQLSLSDFYECGVTRMINQITVSHQI